MMYNSHAFFFFALASVIFFTLLPGAWYRWKFFAMNFIWHSSWSFTWACIHFCICAANFLILRSTWSKKFHIALWFNILSFVLLRVISDLTAMSIFGLSFSVLGLLSLCLLQIRSRSGASVDNLLDLYNNVTFFPALMAGPIRVFKANSRDFFTRGNYVTKDSCINGALIFFLGLLKYLLLATWLAQFKGVLHDASYGGFFNVILYGLASTFSVYVHFAMLSDCGRGVAAVFGVSLSDNFRSLFFAGNPVKLWDRWNITVSHWVRDFVTFPMMLQLGRKLSIHFILLISFIIIGLWHGFGWAWLAFGIFNGLAVSGYSWFERKVSKDSKVLRSVVGGFALIVVLWFNGVIISNYRAYKFLVLQKRTWSDATTDLMHFNYPLFLLAFVIYFAIEWKQERENNLDFHTLYPAPARYIMLIASVFFVYFTMGVLHNHEFTPAYLYFLL